MSAQPYTKTDLERGEEIVKRLHGIRGFEAWAEHIAKAIASERERSADEIERLMTENESLKLTLAELNANRKFLLAE